MTRTLPVEILGIIIEDLISDYAEDDESFKLLPRWYLLSLLLVCKLWNSVSERYLYRSIVIGRPREPTRRFIAVPAVHRTPILPRTNEHKRPIYRIACGLLLALEGNSRRAALVKELRLHWPARFNGYVELIIRIVTICPNLQHVGLLLETIVPVETDSLCKALAQKSLVTFRIKFTDNTQFMPFRIYDLMRRWPEVRKIRQYMPVEDEDDEELEWRADSQAPDAINCCPELREIKLSSHYLRESDLTPLRMMCSVVTKLEISIVFISTEVLDALSGCLRAWSLTLEWLDVDLEWLDDDLEESMTSYLPLSEALSSLTKLQTLIVQQFGLDIDAISSLPYLGYIGLPDSQSMEARLVHLLDDPDKFTALTTIDLCWYASEELEDVCCKRDIELDSEFELDSDFCDSELF